MAIEMVSKVDTFFIFVLFAVALAAAEAIRIEESPDGGVQWLWCSPGHAASGDAACVASTPHHGHQNGPQRRGIRSPPPPISLGIIIAKDHVRVH